ncbi:MAG: regulatory protein TetR [Solirubrobacterales bacterium]|nr:regulatory protein TetR [Solirubrobacterales bacterium]
MPRLAAARETQLTRLEIAAEALRQFDARPTEPSMRSLAAALHVAPTAIYHHFPSRAAIFQAAVELVWNEAMAETLCLVPAPLQADPVDVLVAIGVATRRAWLAHHRVARFMAATPESTAFTRTALGFIAGLLERLQLDDEQLVTAFHSYSSFMVGAVLFAADRKTANEQLAEGRGATAKAPRSPAATPSVASAATHDVLTTLLNLSTTDPARDERLFETGLRRLVVSLSGEKRP